MTFVEYCIATKNYSAIKAVKDYSSEVRQFAMSKKAKVAAGVASGLAALGAGGYALEQSDTDAGRKLRTILGQDTLKDKALNARDYVADKYDELKDKYLGDDDNEDTSEDEDVDDVID